MLPSDIRKRRDWFLPLVGGAEINRTLGKPMVYQTLTSRPYPLYAEDAFTGGTRLADGWVPVFDDKVAQHAPRMWGGELVSYFQTVDNIANDKMRSAPRMRTGALVDSTKYSSFQAGFDKFLGQPRIRAGTMVQTTYHVTYNNALPDRFRGQPRIIRGTIT